MLSITYFCQNMLKIVTNDIFFIRFLPVTMAQFGYPEITYARGVQKEMDIKNKRQSLSLTLSYNPSVFVEMCIADCQPFP